MMKRTTQTGIDEFCKLPITRNRMNLSFKNKRAFFKKIDKLPTGAEWICDIINVVGDQRGPNGEVLTEELELWRRDPVECCRDLIGNPAFKEYMAYGPMKVTRDGVRYYSEANTADWWWNLQGKLPSGAVIAPLIIASDKTNLTAHSGDQTAWPVYLSIGNIDKAVRRQPSAHATVLLGYIPVSKFHSFSKATRSEALYRLFHTCMEKIFSTLVAAGTTGVVMTCADGHIRRVFPILAAYVADYPEQCLIACCKENRCPRCLVPRKKRGERKRFPARNHAATADLLRRVGEGEDPARFTTQGLRPVYRPFWANLPHTDMFECITPDILHQIHKGVIKDHLLPWCQKLVGKKAVDERVAAMPESHGLRHFKKGISLISQWTGTEAKELEKILLGVIAGRADSEIQKAARGLLDFVYYAQYEVHTETTLGQMKRALDSFHRHKEAFIKHEIREHFNIPKVHSLVHYVDAIRRLGCLDGVNTETSERLHIDYAKKAYRASSRREYYTQMTTWLQRQEAIERRDSYLAWHTGQLDEDLKAFLDDREVEQENADEEEEEAADEAEQQANTAEAQDEEVQALRQLMNSNVSRAFQLTLTPTARRVTLERLASGYGAPDFLVEVNAFLSNIDHPPRLRALTSIEIDVYHAINVLLPANIHFANHKRICKIRASPAIPRNRDRRPIPPHFDCGLFIQEEDVYRQEGGLEGLRAGRIRAIFRLPEWLKYDSPLMYVEWFRPFRNPDPVTGMPSTSRSTRAGKRNATVVEASDLLRPCHLIPKFGQDVLNADWAAPDLLDEPITFCFNRYLDYHTFDSLARA
ncbi:uncharacterized protein TRAVEDRAFT_155978 [Trametes versicolor FP-101664 SS1]|uniref:uncharacterized protein n=1 Tax=Trametes versicolor (strain FP-101664) TaxID=717944 RepID=UPI0004621B1D|nr:uncharacterized protein TRAVEDRAFT_155978 [Trametes versicolor FP-101664 SS1]EIW52175.1 hypothetical protein TRAVEDRAFT_155978 [Trametes versicolor FP-101664 SS1]